MGFNVSFDLVSEINLQEHRISIHDHCPIIGIQQVNALSYGIKQFEIEAIGGKKVDHSESYGMGKGEKGHEKKAANFTVGNLLAICPQKEKRC